MNKTRKTLLIVLSVVLALAVLSFVMLALVGWNFANIGGGKTEEKTVSILNSYSNIEVTEVSADVKIEVSTSGNYRVEGYKRGNMFTEVVGSTTSSTLKVTVEDNRAWYEKIFANLSDLSVTIYVPNSDYELIKVKTVSGDITIEDEIDSETVKLSSVSGDIESYTIASEIYNVSSTSGDVSINGYGQGLVNVETTSGDVTMTEFDAESITAKTVSGELYFHNVMATEDMEGETTSGDIIFKYADAEGSMKFVTTSGNIDGEITNSKNIQTSTVSGRVNVPKTFENESLLSMKTTSGNISVKYYGIDM